MAVTAVALAGVFVFDMVVDGGDGTITSDGAFEANELARILTFAPELDDSFEVNEMARLMRLDPEE